MASFGYDPTDEQLEQMFAKYTDKPWEDICKKCGCCRFAHWFGSGIKSGYGPCMIKAHKCNNFID